MQLNALKFAIYLRHDDGPSLQVLRQRLRGVNRVRLAVLVEGAVRRPPVQIGIRADGRAETGKGAQRRCSYGS